MRMGKFFGKIVPIVAMAFAAGVSGCDNIKMNINGSDFDGKPLAEIDLSGSAPTEVALMGPDIVTITEGSKFAITVSGTDAAKDRMRFNLDGDNIAIGRAKGDWKDGDNATVKLVLPSVKELVLAGSGTITSESLDGEAEINVLGSGRVDVAKVAASKLEINIAGSGSLKASGTADELDMSIMGSGNSDLSGLKVGNADVNVMGSGDAQFASDGKVDASIMGSGSITVRGSATCEVSSMGSGTLRCEAGESRSAAEAAPAVTETPEAGEAPDAPESPNAPDAPEAPDA